MYINNLNVFIQVATPLAEIATLTKKNVPRIIYLISGQYYIVAEKDVLTELDNMSDAIFLVFYPLHIQHSHKEAAQRWSFLSRQYFLALLGQLLITLLLETYTSNKLSIIITP